MQQAVQQRLQQIQMITRREAVRKRKQRVLLLQQIVVVNRSPSSLHGASYVAAGMQHQ
jgi:hypothetical protein